mmetsp:Transcript_20196/g.27962  ORF Transcript_20196/g.27962 Transcript_20196/m.27962 type:complete len:208 (+) Transcript_20196:259-882(+)
MYANKVTTQINQAMFVRITAPSLKSLKITLTNYFSECLTGTERLDVAMLLPRRRKIISLRKFCKCEHQESIKNLVLQESPCQMLVLPRMSGPLTLSRGKFYGRCARSLTWPDQLRSLASCLVTPSTSQMWETPAPFLAAALTTKSGLLSFRKIKPHSERTSDKESFPSIKMSRSCRLECETEKYLLAMTTEMKTTFLELLLTRLEYG